MMTKMRILGWDATGFRCPDHSITCCDEHGQPRYITLVQMPNGTGKTTTLALLRAALSGSAENLTSADIRSYQKRNGKEAVARFQLRLAYNAIKVTIIMDFDFDQGEVLYRTTGEHVGGQGLGFIPPRGLKRFMNEEFVKFYVFDGELADRLLNPREVDARKAVDTLFQIHLLSDMNDRVTEHWERLARESSARDRRGFARRQNKLDEWRRRLKKVKAEKLGLESELRECREQLSAEKSKYEQEIKKATELSKQIEHARTNVSNCELRVADCSRHVLDRMREPHALSPSIARNVLALKSGLDRSKLPESAAREFFIELSEERDCICGRPIDDEVKSRIIARASRYFDSDEVSVLNQMKSAVSDAVGDSVVDSSDELNRNIGDLSSASRKLYEARDALSTLQKEAEDADPEVKRARDRCDHLKAKIMEIENRLQKYEGKDLSVRLDRIEATNVQQVHSIVTLEQVIKILDQRVAEVSRTLQMLDKRRVLNAIIERAYQDASSLLADDIRKQTNQVIEKLMPHNDIRIEAIGDCLKLADQSGGSVGENLSVAYAFLSALFYSSRNHELPFVVDSPANPIDLDVRETIGRLVPQLSGQFIAFMISSERDRFLPSIKRSTQSEIGFETVFRQGSSDLESLAASYSTCVRTTDGFQVSGEEFFGKFQLESEEE